MSKAFDADWEEDTNPWIAKGVTHPFENDWFRIDTYDVIHPGGAEGNYSVIRPRRLAVGVLPIEPDGGVHLVGQWRFPLARYSWEMPEGGGEPGEDALTCAKRELAEETGLTRGPVRENSGNGPLQFAIRRTRGAVSGDGSAPRPSAARGHRSAETARGPVP